MNELVDSRISRFNI